MNRYQLLQRLKTANVACFDCGNRYGISTTREATQWYGKCAICDEVKAVTSARDYGYFAAGIRRLRLEKPCCSGVKL